MVTKKQKPNKPLVLLGMALFIAWPLIFFFSQGILIDLIFPNEEPLLVGLTQNEFKVFLATLLAPPITGAILILLATFKKK